MQGDVIDAGEAAKTQRALPRPGQVIDNRYEIVRQLGEGGMGAVFEVKQVVLGTTLAMKVRLPETDDNPEYAKRFAQEARTLAQLNGEHIVRILDYGGFGGLQFLVMPMLTGQSLRAALAARKQMPVREAIEHVLSACEGLAEAHQRGIVHRDIKPDNLFLHVDSSGRQILKILDFGIARVPAASGPALTALGSAPRTPGYAAPEQIYGVGADARADIFALGVLLHELISGGLPFPDGDFTRRRSPLGGVSAELDAVVAKCLRQPREERFPNVAALAAALCTVPEVAGSMQHAVMNTADAVAKTLETTVDIASYDFETASELAVALKNRENVIFLFGSGLTAPRDGQPGVPGVEAMIELIQAEYRRQNRQDLLAGLEKALSTTAKRYQTAFGHYSRYIHASAPNRLVRKAVLRARKEPPEGQALEHISSDGELCEELERDIDGWHLPKGVDALARALSAFASGKFVSTILTSNFDPLITVALRRHRVPIAGDEPIVMNLDGTFASKPGEGVRIVHFHGDWCRKDTMHTVAQLQAPRARLVSTIKEILNTGTLVVMAYGGWDDVMVKAIVEAFNDHDVEADVRWTFYEEDPVEIHRKYAHVFKHVANGLTRGRVFFYRDVDVHEFLDGLARSQAPQNAMISVGDAPPPVNGVNTPPSASDPLPLVNPVSGAGQQPVVPPEAPVLVPPTPPVESPPPQQQQNIARPHTTPSGSVITPVPPPEPPESRWQRIALAALAVLAAGLVAWKFGPRPGEQMVTPALQPPPALPSAVRLEEPPFVETFEYRVVVANFGSRTGCPKLHDAAKLLLKGSRGAYPSRRTGCTWVFTVPETDRSEQATVVSESFRCTLRPPPTKDMTVSFATGAELLLTPMTRTRRYKGVPKYPCAEDSCVSCAGD